MNFIISMLMLLLWSLNGFERIEMLVASIIFAALYIPETYIHKKFKRDEFMKETINKQLDVVSENK